MRETIFWKRWGHIRNNIFQNCKEDHIIPMTKKKVDSINKIFIKNFKTVLTLNGFIKELNSSGTESNKGASEILITSSTRNKFSGHRSINAIKKVINKKGYSYLNNLINLFHDFNKF